MQFNDLQDPLVSDIRVIRTDTCVILWAKGERRYAIVANTVDPIEWRLGRHEYGPDSVTLHWSEPQGNFSDESIVFSIEPPF